MEEAKIVFSNVMLNGVKHLSLIESTDSSSRSSVTQKDKKIQDGL